MRGASSGLLKTLMATVLTILTTSTSVSLTTVPSFTSSSQTSLPTPLSTEKAKGGHHCRDTGNGSMMFDRRSDQQLQTPVPMGEAFVQNTPPSAQRMTAQQTSDNVTTSVMTTDDVTSERPLTQEIVVMTYLCGVLLLSLLCNGTIGCVFYNKPQLLTVSNYFVLNLACCELGLSLLVLPFSAASVVRGHWVLSEAWCRSESYVLVVLLVALHYSLLAISLDRNFAIVNSLRYPYVFTHTLGSSIIAGTWILGLAVGLPPLVGWGAFKYDDKQFLCSIDWQADLAYTLFFLVLVFVLPLLVQACCYLSIFRAALGHTKRSAKVFPSAATTTTTTTTATSTTISTTSNTVSSGESASEDNVDQTPTGRGSSHSAECKAVKTIVLIAAAYFACWTLYVLVAVLQCWGMYVAPSTELAASALLFLSCMLNPLIYGFMNRVTRFEICKLLSRVSQRLSGRPPPPFVENDDPISSTWTTTLSSTRQPTGLWVTPAQRMRRNSKSVTCAVRNMEMVTIREETEEEEESGGVPDVSDILSSDSTSAEPTRRHAHHALDPTADCEPSCVEGVVEGGVLGTDVQSRRNWEQSPLVLNAPDLHSTSLPLGRKRVSCFNGPPLCHHHLHNHNHLDYHPQHEPHHHSHRHIPPHNYLKDTWDLLSVDPELPENADILPVTVQAKHCQLCRRHSANTISTSPITGTSSSPGTSSRFA